VIVGVLLLICALFVLNEKESTFRKCLIDILIGSMVKRPIIEENEGKKMKNIGEDKR